MPFTRRAKRATAIETLEDRRLFSVGDTYVAPASPRVAVNLNAGWKFTLTPGSNPQATAADDSAWAGVSLPHTWNKLDAQDGGDNYARGPGWYRRAIAVPANTSGDSFYLHFDGASLVTRVYVDGVSIGQHSGAFGAFNVDVTTALADGRSHVLAIQCDNSASLEQTVAPTDGADLNVYGGIYRGMSLLAVPPQRATMDDLGSAGVAFDSSAVSSTSATIQIKTILQDSAAAKSVIVRSVLSDATGKIVAEASSTQPLTAAGATVTQSAAVANPHLWNGVKDPYLHDLTVEIRDAGTGALLDLVRQRVGIRSFAVDPNKGFLLNGQVYPLHGIFYHQDKLNLGWAISDSDTQSDINLIAAMGATAVRSQYQLSPLFYQLAAEKGLLVQSEVAFNGSDNRNMTVSKDAFLANAKTQLLELMRQTHNAPSVVSYSLYNEVVDNATNDDIVKQLAATAKAEDPSRLTTGATWNKKIGTLEKLTDVIQLNRYYGWYETQVADLATLLDTLHSANPTAVIGMSEWGAASNIGQHGVQTGITPKAYTQPEEFQTNLIEKTYPITAARPWLWTNDSFAMFDFANDQANNGPQKGRSNYGVASIDRLTKKDPYYYFQANWSASPVLHLNSKTWTTRPDQSTDIKVYSNVGPPQLYVNGTFVGTMQSLGYCVYTMPSFLLSRGANAVTVKVVSNNVTYTDSATWTYTGNGTNPTPPPPPATGSIAGIAFSDANLSGAYDKGDSLIAGRRMFLDTDGDNVLDPGEPTQLTGSNGGFSFTNLAAGTYRVREVYPSNAVAATTPPDVTLSAGQTVTGIAIGTRAAGTPPPVVNTPVTLQAEDAVLSGGTYKQSNHSNSTGTGFADYGGDGSAAQFSVSRNTAGAATLTFRYSNGGSTARPLSIKVNGVLVGSTPGASTGSWETWVDESITVSLLAGTNLIVATAGPATGGNLDRLTVT